MPNFETLYSERLNLEINDSDSAVLYTTARRQQAINDAQEEFADLTECLVRQADITCSCNVTEYQILANGVLGTSTDFSRFGKQGIEYILTDSNGRISQHLSGPDFPERPVQFRNTYEPGWRQSTAVTKTPSGYSIRKDGGNVYVTLNEPPDIGSGETAVIRVGYIARPAPMVSSGTEPFTVNSSARTDLRVYHKFLPHYAAFKLLPLIGDMDGANRQLQLFLGGVARYQQADRPRGGQVVMAGRSYFNESRRIGRASDLSLDTDPRWRWN